MRELIVNVGKNKQYFFVNQSILKSRNYSTQTQWKGVVGLEVHAQINSASKLFSGASTYFGERVNNSVSLFDAAIPGTLPVLNKKCVEYGVLTALALNCSINPVSLFDRKHYFYADLPAGYQITQQRKPLAKDGVLEFPVYLPSNKFYKKSSRIKQIQLEQDSGKSIHDEEAQRSLVDLNRAGVPLMEIVFEPDLEHEGSLRVDANVSVHKPGTPLGVRSEIKNIGSIRGVANAIDFEIERQKKLLSSGMTVVNETRNWDAGIGETLPMRDKEEKQDYRFMPEPNLPPLHINVSNKETNRKNIINVIDIKRLIPELPEETRNKLTSKYNLLPQIVMILVDEERLLQLFNNILNKNPERTPKRVANFLINELLTLINKDIIALEQCDDEIEIRVGEIIDLINNQDISLINSRLLLEEVLKGNKLPSKELMEERGWKQMSDIQEIKMLCEGVVKNNPKMVAQYKAGKHKVYKALLGQVFKVSNKNANMALVDKVLKELLQKEKF
ncbi:glutamyl-tRNA(Gln) amidotransferase subunit B, mitochondrial isoform X2 [Lycorma delicatula]|uniref:glutamyl-tRNA(Gln) amidotransferase subunit B, mitochondrial isoform X2 n=1 Tax=Lycorma delicatula TaxID=130591 RepID=UPI003F512064